MEAKAFSWIQEGKTDQAKKVLFNKDYEEQKLIFSKGIQDFVKEIILGNQKEIDDNNSRLIVFTFASSLLILSSWVAGLITFQKYSSQRRRSEDLSTKFSHILDDSFNEIYVFDSKSLKFHQVSNCFTK